MCCRKAAPTEIGEQFENTPSIEDAIQYRPALIEGLYRKSLCNQTLATKSMYRLNLLLLDLPLPLRRSIKRLAWLKTGGLALNCSKFYFFQFCRAIFPTPESDVGALFDILSTRLFAAINLQRNRLGRREENPAATIAEHRHSPRAPNIVVNPKSYST